MRIVTITAKLDAISTYFFADGKRFAEIWKQGGRYYIEMPRDMHPHGCKQETGESFANSLCFLMECINRYFKIRRVEVVYIIPDAYEKAKREVNPRPLCLWNDADKQRLLDLVFKDPIL